MAPTQRCMCGFWGDKLQECSCTPIQLKRYWGKLSGPLLDRIDIQLEVPRLEHSDVLRFPDKRSAESSATIRERVIAARELQNKRFAQANIFCNAQMQSREISRYCQVDDPGRQLLHHALKRMHLSARAYDRILKVARTIADLDGSPDIGTPHIAEAIQFRTLDRRERLAA